VIRFVERDEHVRNDFTQASVLSTREGRAVESGLDRVLLLKRIGIAGNIDERVDRWLVVFNGASSSAFGVNAEIDLAAFS